MLLSRFRYAKKRNAGEFYATIASDVTDAPDVQVALTAAVV
jgi:hypothetical protein